MLAKFTAITSQCSLHISHYSDRKVGNRKGAWFWSRTGFSCVGFREHWALSRKNTAISYLIQSSKHSSSGLYSLSPFYFVASSSFVLEAFIKFSRWKFKDRKASRKTNTVVPFKKGHSLVNVGKQSPKLDKSLLNSSFSSASFPSTLAANLSLSTQVCSRYQVINSGRFSLPPCELKWRHFWKHANRVSLLPYAPSL